MFRPHDNRTGFNRPTESKIERTEWDSDDFQLYLMVQHWKDQCNGDEVKLLKKCADSLEWRYRRVGIRYDALMVKVRLSEQSGLRGIPQIPQCELDAHYAKLDT